jgi:hypothetical protein
VLKHTERTAHIRARCWHFGERQNEASLCQGRMFGFSWARRVVPLSMAVWARIIVAVGPGTDLSKVPVFRVGISPLGGRWVMTLEGTAVPTLRVGCS